MPSGSTCQADGRTATRSGPGATGVGEANGDRPEPDPAVVEAGAVEQHRLAHEGGDELAAGALVQLGRRAGLRDPAVVHHDDLVADRHRLGLVVRHVGDGQREAPLQRADLLAHRAAQPRIEVRQRLVEQQHRRLEHQRAGQRDALLLAARQLARQPLVEAGQADQRERARARRCALGLRRRRETSRP